MSHFTDYRTQVGSDADRFFKTTLFASERLLLGLNCLEPGQAQKLHDHAGQDKFYFVIEGVAEFVVGSEQRVTGPGTVVWAPTGTPHGVTNHGAVQLVLLVGIAPAPAR